MSGFKGQYKTRKQGSSKKLSDKQQLFLDKLFTEFKGKVAPCARAVGYSEHSITWLTDTLKEEIVNAATKYMAANAGQAVFTLIEGMEDNATATQITAAKEVLDRGGVPKQAERPMEITTDKLFILPPKQDMADIDDEEDFLPDSEFEEGGDQDT